MARTFERALRRAGVPMAYSQGFSPHPKVSWVGAAPTGVASEAEYVEIQVVREIDPEALRRELDRSLPPGLDVLEAVTARAAGGSLADRIEASLWRIELPGVAPEDLAEATRRLLAAERVEVERLTKDGRRTLDARAAVVSAEVVAGDEPVTDGDQLPAEPTAQVADWPEWARPCGILVAVVRQTTPAVRPDDVLSALRVVADLVPPVPAKATRMAQGRLDDSGVPGTLVDPLAADRAASPTATPSGVDDPAVR
ncbi:radical SAM-linked protein [Streptoalloteichus tenebrarius]|uniref:Radical SAM-linked protein n=1 Tax=Streptoalloteichus tenebrarius (strain ATCC 17920 / DSM 40477 / JCM 4838 / CBS 697.72 / NBRC 16177 / NCIMB 11028 / NRRL B-12390 / A12253. 1 / ISP 5477) TaxID=1933 RepID=A0ABT1HXA3_STRSD|nr:radical SAM-linked protein [Streptoalloteichus tenebrarius]BFF00542.1 TIGR03936 family radical SAM-associated protein [Streptoalloteichus tenebrarius]